ncbi:hypothetical protein DPMN_155309 [Dreissena polymorpha]|uniref:Uncharacterized protein n=1 Tax=Dreissena polymorpha TaxID=45954 RepID=A0A9D4J6I7_DREPO|nr:hypothetical protein DPMN_155309 [Dreissena polymorpha]
MGALQSTISESSYENFASPRSSTSFLPNIFNAWREELLLVTDEKDILITSTELMSKNQETVGYNEDIKLVTAYKVPLSGYQCSKNIFYHMFVVFQTQNWWWSIEKDTDLITLQRFRNESDVKKRYKNTTRNSWITEIKRDGSIKKVQDLINWLHENDELKQDFHWFHRNSQHFGFSVFNFLSRTETL